MIQLIYSQLTGRVVQPPTVGVDPTARQGADPSFMGPNASTLLGQKIKESEMSTTLIDQKAAQSRAKAILDEHESNLNANRPEQPSRMASMSGYKGSAAAARMLRGETKPVAQANETQSAVRFQEVRPAPPPAPPSAPRHLHPPPPPPRTPLPPAIRIAPNPSAPRSAPPFRTPPSARGSHSSHHHQNQRHVEVSRGPDRTARLPPHSPPATAAAPHPQLHHGCTRTRTWTFTRTCTASHRVSRL